MAAEAVTEPPALLIWPGLLAGAVGAPASSLAQAFNASKLSGTIWPPSTMMVWPVM